jgi:hypothetical protein
MIGRRDPETVVFLPRARPTIAAPPCGLIKSCCAPARGCSRPPWVKSLVSAAAGGNGLIIAVRDFLNSSGFPTPPARLRPAVGSRGPETLSWEWRRVRSMSGVGGARSRAPLIAQSRWSRACSWPATWWRHTASRRAPVPSSATLPARATTARQRRHLGGGKNGGALCFNGTSNWGTVADAN